MRQCRNIKHKYRDIPKLDVKMSNGPLGCCLMFLIGLFFFLFAFSSHAEFTGLVTKVIDGDTFEVNNIGIISKIRINAIDAPEKSQAFGNKSKEFLNSLIYGKEVVVFEKDKDKYERTIADVKVSGVDVGEKMIKDGYAWHYKKHSDNWNLATFEANAKNLKLGLWADPQASPPWTYRDKSTTSSTLIQSEKTSLPIPTVTQDNWEGDEKGFQNPGMKKYQQTPSVSNYEQPNYTGYGAISERTGNPRTNWVNPYTKKDGTRVEGYWKSKSKK